MRFDEATCPFCGTAQEVVGPDPLPTDDLDKDGIPDLAEKSNPVLNYRYPYDSMADYDGDGFLNIEEYVNDPVIKEHLDKVINSMSSSQFKISVETENDNVLVYKYVFQRELSDAQRENVAEQIEKSLSSYDSIYNSLVDTLKKDVDVDNPKVRLVYETSDGQKITEKTWVSKD